MFFVYILESEHDGSYYIGFSAEPDRRLQDHNQGKSRYTRLKCPWKRVHIESFALKKDALKREKYIKRMKSRKYIQSLIQGNDT